MNHSAHEHLVSLLAVPTVMLFVTCAGAAGLQLGPAELVQSGGVNIVVPGYSVPSFVDWNNDSLPDLIVGDGGTSGDAKVRVYANVGTAGNPLFSGFVYAQTGTGDLSCPASGCLGVYPRVVQWNADGKKDLLAGQADGTVKLFTNTGTDAAPMFDGGVLLEVGNPGAKVPIDIGDRATSNAVDWNNDGRKDLVVGGLDGKFHLFLNEGTDTAPDFRAETFASAGAGDLVVATARSSPSILDLDGDGKKDILTGNTSGQLLFYSNIGTDADPDFGGFVQVESDGVPIDLPGTPRSRPFVCDWTGDGAYDVLLGAGDGTVRLYQGVPEPATLSLLAIGGLVLLRRR